MLSYIVEGGKQLSGEVAVSGSKNASLPIIAACILNGGITKLYNVPQIHDTQMMFEILKKLGCKIKKGNGKIIIDSSEMDKYEIPDDLMREMRSSVIIAGALIGRFKKAKFSYPGGCDIGARPIDLHLKAFENLGVHIEEDDGFIQCSCEEISGNEIHLDFPSVGATENAMLTAVFGNGETKITNAAMEPEIIDLQNCLNRMGANIIGAGTNLIKINGVKRLKEISYTIMPDRIEAGTLLCAATITNGDIILKNVVPDHLSPVLHKLEECGCKLDVKKNEIMLIAPKKLKAIDVKTMPYPGFPTDMQSVFATVLCIAKGTSIVIENIFENRFKYANELKRMGARITIEGRAEVIKGVKRLSKAEVNATDLRGGAALVLAGLNAKGKTKINHIEYILRGYENLDKKLNKLGASVIIEKV